MLAVFCADVGSVRSGNFGWFGVEPSGAESYGTTPDELVEHLAMTARAGIPIALGFECPLFLPVPSTAVSLGAARQGEGNRAWSAGAGAGSLATGLVQVAWIARELKARVQDVTFSVDIQRFLGEPNGVLIWEAFVSGASHGETHVDDARAAVQRFQRGTQGTLEASAVTCDPCLSLAGAALLFAGAIDSGLICRSCYVMKV